jgi:hypothetical protein
MATRVPIGRPRYSIGNTAAATRPRPSRSPRHVVNDIAARPMNAEMRIVSSDSPAAVGLTTPPSQRDATPTDVSSVATPLTTAGNGYPTALDRREYSMNASSSRASAAAKNNGADANQTTAIVRTTRATPLQTRVTWR